MNEIEMINAGYNITSVITKPAALAPWNGIKMQISPRAITPAKAAPRDPRLFTFPADAPKPKTPAPTAAEIRTAVVIGKWLFILVVFISACCGCVWAIVVAALMCAWWLLRFCNWLIGAVLRDIGEDIAAALDFVESKRIRK